MATVDICLTAGQSNMSGVGDATKAPGTSPTLCLEWKGGPGLVQIAEPGSTDSPYKPETGSCVPAFANMFTSASGRPLVVVRAARGGTSLLASNAQPGGNGTWDTTGTLFPNSITRLNQCISDVIALGHTIGHVFVIWSQGGRDALGGNDLELYQAANEAIVSRWRTGTSIPTLQVFMEELSSYCDGDRGNPNFQIIRDAENAAAANADGLHMAFNEGKTFGERGWMRWDCVHYSQTGYNYMGTQMARYAAEHYGYTVDPVDPPIDPGGATSIPGVMLKFAKPLPPFPRTFGIGTTRIVIPTGYTALLIEGEGPGGKGGNGAVGLKGGAAGGGAYCKVNSLAVTPGQEYDVTVTAGGSEAPCTVTRVSDSTIVYRVAAGKNGVNGNPNGDGAGGLASDCIGDVKTSGQNGGVSGIDNGGNGAAPLGGAGATGPGQNAGGFPGGGGSAANAGGSQLGGAGAAGTIIIRTP